jgi:Na+/H+ antiporter
VAPIETVVEILFCAILIGLGARRARIPYPVALVLGGLVLAFLPGPPLVLDPDLALALFIPPVLYQAALVTSWRETRENIGSIALLAIGLVTFTTVAVAAAAHLMFPAMGWAPAFVLGAIVSPSDAVAAITVMHRLNISRRIIAIVEGESLINDATGLVFYKYATAAVVLGSFSLPRAAADFLLIGAGGAAMGLIAGWIFVKLQRHLADPLIESTYSLILPFAVYITAQYVGVSGVIAVVAAGLVRGHYYPEILSARARVQGLASWDIVIFILNNVSFVLIGLQLHSTFELFRRYPAAILVGVPIAISAVVIVARVLWVFAMAYLPRRKADPPDPKEVTIVAWTGMRGIVSLATALGLPLSTSAGASFPARDFIFLSAFAVILATLVVQGLTLGPLIRWLGLGEDPRIAGEEVQARMKAAQAALAELAKFSSDPTADPRMLRRVRAEYERRISSLHDISLSLPSASERHANAMLREVRLAALTAERRQIIEMRNLGLIGDEVMHRIERELDLVELELK